MFPISFSSSFIHEKTGFQHLFRLEADSQTDGPSRPILSKAIPVDQAKARGDDILSADIELETGAEPRHAIPGVSACRAADRKGQGCHLWDKAVLPQG
jgi:hypothetical protein